MAAPFRSPDTPSDAVLRLLVAVVIVALAIVSVLLITLLKLLAAELGYIVWEISGGVVLTLVAIYQYLKYKGFP